MFKLYKNFKWKDLVGIILIIALTVLQVYLTMTIVDYVQGIIKAIMYLNYHNHPETISVELKNFLLLVGNNDLANGWQYLLNNQDKLSFNFSQIDMLLDVARASVKDIWIEGLYMMLCAFGIMAVQALISLIASYVAANLSTSIRKKLYHKVEGFSLSEMSSFQTSSLITRTTNDIQQVQMANLLTMRMVFAAPITAIWALVKIKASSSVLTLATAISIILLVVFIGLIMIIALPKFKSMQSLTDKLNSVTRENLTGIRIVRAFNAEDYIENRFEEANKNVTNTQIFTGRIMALMSPFMMIVMNGISLAIYWIGANLINKGEIDYATVSSFMMLSSQIIMSFVMLMMMFVMWPRALVSAKRINEVLDTKEEILDPITPLPFKEKGTIEFKNVSFKYPGSSNYQIEDISFKVNKGETIAFIGATGTGKTTIVNLIPRLFDASLGEVLVDGVNVKDINKHDLRNIIGYVPQKAILFKGSIFENIKLKNQEKDLDSVKNAARIACASDFIEAFDKGYDYEISQGGKNVSGGQRQRLCIARAVLSDPEILIFDDSFSALDYKTDLKVRQNLKESLHDTTKVIVAQRIGTILDADKIVVLSDGHICGIGTHEELIKNNKIYQEIALSQLSKEELGL